MKCEEDRSERGRRRRIEDNSLYLCVCVQTRTKELEGLQQQVEELQAQVLSMEGTKGWFERRLKEAEVSPTCLCCFKT